MSIIEKVLGYTFAFYVLVVICLGIFGGSIRNLPKWFPLAFWFLCVVMAVLMGIMFIGTWFSK